MTHSDGRTGEPVMLADRSPTSCAVVRSVLVRLEPVTLALSRSMLVSVAPVRLADTNCAPVAPALVRFASDRSALARLAPARLAPARSQPLQSTPGDGVGVTAPVFESTCGQVAAIAAGAAATIVRLARPAPVAAASTRRFSLRRSMVLFLLANEPQFAEAAVTRFGIQGSARHGRVGGVPDAEARSLVHQLTGPEDDPVALQVRASTRLCGVNSAEGDVQTAVVGCDLIAGLEGELVVQNVLAAGGDFDPARHLGVIRQIVGGYADARDCGLQGRLLDQPLLMGQRAAAG